MGHDHGPECVATCFYCDKGRVQVIALPCECPECGMLLKKLYDEMSDEEQRRAVEKKMLRYPPEYFLAS